MKSSPLVGRWQREALTEGGGAQLRSLAESREPPPPPSAVPLPASGEDFTSATGRYPSSLLPETAQA